LVTKHARTIFQINRKAEIMTLSLSQRAHRSISFLEQVSWYRALTLRERLALRNSTNTPDQGDGDVHRTSASQRLERWRNQPPFSQESCFAERLALDNLSEEELLAVLAENSQPLQQCGLTMPDWLRT
jgi:hypothetical protein